MNNKDLRDDCLSIISKELLIRLGNLEASLVKIPSVKFIEICSRSKKNEKGWYLSLLIEENELNDDDIDEIVFEIVCNNDNNKFSFNGDFSFGGGRIYEKMKEIEIILSNKSKNTVLSEFENFLSLYFDDADNNLKNMITEISK